MESLLFSTLLLLKFVGCGCVDTDHIDLTKDCKDNVKINFFLTHGMGYTDGLSIYIGNFYKNCTVFLYTNKMENTSQIIVFEKLSNVGWSEFCGNNSIKIADEYKVINLCKQLQPLNKHILYVGVTECRKTVIQINGSSPEMLKVTATSARKFKEDEECSSLELECKISNDSFCINADLQCDGNINCGHYEVFDEDSVKCYTETYKSYVILIIARSVLSIIILIIIVKLCNGCFPKTPRKFLKTEKFENNKLFVNSRFDKPKISIQEKKKPPITASGDTFERIEEREIRTLYYEKPSKKRLATNSPIYRNTRVTTILLDDMKNIKNAGRFVSYTGIGDLHSRVSEFWKNKSKCRSFI